MVAGTHSGWLGLILAVAFPLAAADLRLSGLVVDENNTPVAQARVIVRPAGNPAAAPIRAVTNLKGAFALPVAAPGEYRVEVDCDGYFRLQDRHVEVGNRAPDLTFVLNHTRELYQSLDVPAQLAEIDVDRTVREKRLSENQVLSIPYPATNSVRNALRLMPGVVQDSRGGLHVDGAAEDQVMYTLDGFNISDPLTGKFESRLSVESVRSLELTTGRFSAEYGKGSAGAVEVKTIMGADKIRYSATNFVPGIENHKGLQIGNWTPRLGVSGPIKRGRAWFSDSIDAQYDRNVVEELPKGHDSSVSWRWSNLLRGQVNITPSNILFSGILVNWWQARRTGLSIMDPLETTIDRRSRQWFFHLKDQIYLGGRGALAEVGYAANRTFGRELPQAYGMMAMTIEGKRGSHYVDAARKSSRDQWIANVFLPPMGGGLHRVKTGVDLDRVSYSQDARRTGYGVYSQNGLLSRRVVFGGNGGFARATYETSAYVQDSWRVRPSLLVDLGLRFDRDGLVSNNNLSPRFGFGWSPFGSVNTRISGGFAVVYDASSLRLFTRPLDQFSITEYFDMSGAMVRGPAVSVFTIDPALHLHSPRYQSWSLGLERRLPGNAMLRVDWVRRRGRDGFTYAGVPEPVAVPAPVFARFADPLFDAVYTLGNSRRDVYDSFSAVVRRSFRGQYEFMAAYTRSRALSNAVTDVAVDDPVIVSNNVGPMPWDAPHRFQTWGYLPTPLRRWSVAYLLDARNGFPFSIQDDTGRLVESINSRRFPLFFEANVHLERKLSLKRHFWALRVGCNNITGRRNPTVVNANTSSPNFLQYYGAQGRTLNFRIRWLGRVDR